MEIGSKCFR